jgi:hypothetical protein
MRETAGDAPHHGGPVTSCLNWPRALPFDFPAAIAHGEFPLSSGTLSALDRHAERQRVQMLVQAA